MFDEYVYYPSNLSFYFPLVFYPHRRTMNICRQCFRLPGFIFVVPGINLILPQTFFLFPGPGKWKFLPGTIKRPSGSMRYLP